MEDRKNLRRSTRLMILLWLLMAVIAIAGVSYAWFTFQASTNVTPMTGSSISEGGANLMISNNPNEGWGNDCQLILASHSEALDPISTNDLNKFYKATGQDTNGISVFYKDATNEVDDSTMRGTIYLRSDGGDMDVYLFPPKLSFGTDVQALASLRLGMRFSGSTGSSTYIFKLDDMADTRSAEKRLTVQKEGTVVSSVSNGAANFVTDGALNLSDFSANATSADDENPTAGRNSLYRAQTGQVVTVEYWLYLEGCDVNCINSVQNKDVALQLSFAGVTIAQ